MKARNFRHMVFALVNKGNEREKFTARVKKLGVNFELQLSHGWTSSLYRRRSKLLTELLKIKAVGCMTRGLLMLN